MGGPQKFMSPARTTGCPGAGSLRRSRSNRIGDPCVKWARCVPTTVSEEVPTSTSARTAERRLAESRRSRPSSMVSTRLTGRRDSKAFPHVPARALPHRARRRWLRSSASPSHRERFRREFLGLQRVPTTLAASIVFVFAVPPLLEIALDRPNNLDALLAYLHRFGGTRNTTDQIGRASCR